MEMVRVGSNSEMERILPRGLGNTLVGADTTSLKHLARQLFVLLGNEVRAEGEFVDVCTFTSQIEDTDLGVLLGSSLQTNGKATADRPWVGTPQ
jgi:hypothetical protein